MSYFQKIRKLDSAIFNVLQDMFACCPATGEVYYKWKILISRMLRLVTPKSKEREKENKTTEHCKSNTPKKQNDNIKIKPD
jgi:hypothetical protein